MIDSAKDTVVGVYDMARHPIQTAKAIGSALSHPIVTGKAVIDSITTSFKKDIINGNADTRARFVGRVIGEVALSVVGTKGLDKVSKADKVADGAKLLKYADEVENTAEVVNDLNDFKINLQLFGNKNTGKKVNDITKGMGKLLDDDLAKMYKNVQEGIGSTGRTIPNTLKEQLVMKQVLSNPLEGAKDLYKYITMSDKGRWVAEDGWIKISNNVKGIEIHFNYNKITGAFDDFKFK